MLTHKEIFKLDINSWFDFENIYDAAVNNFDNAIFIEIGSYQGASACYLANKIKESGKNIKLFCIDTWNPKDSNERRLIPKDKLLKEIFIENCNKLDLYINTIDADSITALNTFQDKSVDFIFIDGDHSYEQVYKDIIIGLKKIKVNGWLGGHDYPNYSVKKAVYDTIGNINEIQSTRTDRYYSSWLYKKEH